MGKGRGQRVGEVSARLGAPCEEGGGPQRQTSLILNVYQVVAHFCSKEFAEGKSGSFPNNLQGVENTKFHL